MKNLIIIGARGFGREVYNLAISCNGFNEEYIIKGFLDDKSEALDGFENYPPILSPVEEYVILKDDIFICALGSVIFKKKYSQIILDKGGEFITLIHPTALISINLKIGIGCIIGSFSVISCDIKIGNFVTIQPFSDLGHDVKVGDWCHINCYSFLGGFVQVEEEATINTGAIIHPDKEIGKSAIVGAGSVVIRNVPPNITVYGNPAIELKY
jgi:sugar O-acyltransferase (sialic acid O-acetyltransferase NeuD family)